MQLLQLAGILLIVNTLTCAGWFFSQNKEISVTGTALVAFSIVAGLALVFHERALDVTLGKFASIKAAAKQATADAKEIADIRDRVEAQAATLDLVAKASSDAKKLLEDLRAETKTADEKLKQLEKKTSEIVKLPDGRTKMGGMISGAPTVLDEQLKQINAALNASDPKTAFALIRKAIETYEQSQAMSEGAGFSVDSINMDVIAQLYEVGAVLALDFRDNPAALAWSQKALSMKPTPERNAHYVAALVNSGKTDEAQKIIDETMTKNEAGVEAFKARLQKLEILK